MLRRPLVILTALCLALAVGGCSDSSKGSDGPGGGGALGGEHAGSEGDGSDPLAGAGDPADDGADGGGSEDGGAGLGGSSDGGPDEYPEYCELVRNKVRGFDLDLELEQAEAMLAVAPDEIKDEHEIQVEDIKVRITEQDDVNAPNFRSEEVLEADATVIRFDFEHCDL